MDFSSSNMEPPLFFIIIQNKFTKPKNQPSGLKIRMQSSVDRETTVC
jgi:hypothetical protein